MYELVESLARIVGVIFAGGVGLGFVYFVVRLIAGRGIGRALAVMVVFFALLAADVALMDVVNGRDPVEATRADLAALRGGDREAAPVRTAPPAAVETPAPTPSPTPDEDYTWQAIVFKLKTALDDTGMPYTLYEEGDNIGVEVASDDITVEVGIAAMNGEIPDGWPGLRDSMCLLTRNYKDLADEHGYTEKHFYASIENTANPGAAILLVVDGSVLYDMFPET